MFYIKFQTREYEINGRIAFKVKQKLIQTDCNMKASDHYLYNTALFTHVLNSQYRRLIGQHTDVLFKDDLPDNVSVVTGNFLSTIFIELPETFK